MIDVSLPESTVIAQTRHWISTVVIGHQFCPFAAQVFNAQHIHYQVHQDGELESCLHALIAECQRLDRDQAIATTLLIFPNSYERFEDYLQLVDLAEQLLVDQGYQGIYQLASFHPNYRFEGEDDNDPANYTNRSPYPMLHVLREQQLEQAIANYPNPDSIPKRNIAYARRMGLKKLAELLDNSLKL